jgi:hypothetical protein
MLSAELLRCQSKCYIISNFKTSLFQQDLSLTRGHIHDKVYVRVHVSPSQKGMDIMEYFVEQQNSIPMIKHPMIQAYKNSNASRCGCCMPGLLDRKKTY